MSPFFRDVAFLIQTLFLCRRGRGRECSAAFIGAGFINSMAGEDTVSVRILALSGEDIAPDGLRVSIFATVSDINKILQDLGYWWDRISYVSVNEDMKPKTNVAVISSSWWSRIRMMNSGYTTQASKCVSKRFSIAKTIWRYCRSPFTTIAAHNHCGS